MQTDKKEVITVIIFLLFIIGGLVGQGVWIVLIPFSLLFLFKAYPWSAYPKLSVTDCFVAFVCSSEVLSYVFSAYSPNSIRSSLPVFLVAYFWFFFRIVVKRENQYKYMTIGGSCLALILSIITIGTFLHFKSEFSGYDVASLTDFKQEFRPFGLPVNDWVAFLLCLLPYPLMAAFNSGGGLKCVFHMLVAALLTSSVLLSLSRGAYLALFVFHMALVVFLIVYGGKKMKRYLLLTGISALIGLLVIFPARMEVITTCAMSKTTSQRLSTEGRLKLIEDAASLWKESPVTGIGQGNFNIIYDGSIADRKSSSVRATNTYALILVERGTIGLLACCGVVLSALIIGLKRMKKCPGTMIFEAGLLALCVRGLFFSSLYKINFVLVLFMLVVFNIVQEYGDEEVRQQ